MEAAKMTETGPVSMKFEAVIIGVSDVDRSKAFYEKLGWRLDADFSFDTGFRIVQFTPPASECSIQFGTNVTAAAPGSTQGLYLIVTDIDAARSELISHGVEVSEVFHAGTPGAQFQPQGTSGRVPGHDPQGRSYFTFASFQDPDGNGWLLQEIQSRLPGREWTPDREPATDIAATAVLLRETSERHNSFEETHVKHNWWDWYAADRYMEDVLHVGGV